MSLKRYLITDQHRPILGQPPVNRFATGTGRQAGNIALLAAKIEALKAEIARLETTAADHRADFERECERADRLTVELLQSTAEIMAAKEMTARLEEEVAALRSGGQSGGSTDAHGQAARRLGHLAASIVQADRKADR